MTPNTPEALRDVFLCHASQDGTAANRLVTQLEAAGLRCWIAPRDVTPGSLYAESIVNAINGTRFLVVILSSHAVASPHVGKEIEGASSKRHPIIAIRTDATPLPPAFEYFLSESHWVEGSVANLEALAPGIVSAVHALRAAPNARPSPALLPPPATVARRRRVLIGGAIAAALVTAMVAGVQFMNARHRADGPHAALRSGLTTEKSIAVLPFVDMSEKKDQEYFADGMAEEILDLLTKIPGLTVIGRTSSFQFKGHNEDLRAIGSKLNAAYVLEGSVRRSADQARITAQLIDAQTGTHVWSETYDRRLDDVLRETLKNWS